MKSEVKDGRKECCNTEECLPIMNNVVMRKSIVVKAVVMMKKVE